MRERAATDVGDASRRLGDGCGETRRTPAATARESRREAAERDPRASRVTCATPRPPSAGDAAPAPVPA